LGGPCCLPLRIYPTEVAAKRAGLHLADLSGERPPATLYALLPEGDKKLICLLSSSYRAEI